MGGGFSLQFLVQELPPNVIGIFAIGSFLIQNSIVFRNDTKPRQIPVFMMHGKIL